LKHTDDKIREIFSNKLGEWESDVPHGMWESVSAKISTSSSAATGAAAAAKGISAKLLTAIAAAAIAVGGVIYTFSTQDSSATEVNSSRAEVNNVNSSSGATSGNEQITTPSIIENNDLVPPVATQEDNSAIKPQVESQNNETPNNSNSIEEQKQVVTPVHLEKPVVQEKPASLGNEKAQDANPEKQGNENYLANESLTAAFTVVPVDVEEQKYFFMAESANAKSYAWDFGDGSSSTELSPTHEYQEEGDYSVTLVVRNSSNESLSVSKDLKVVVPGKMLIPTIFSPNGDGFNDFFDIREKSEGIDFSSVIVRDANGKAVFESDGTLLWDGNDPGGNHCAEGTYLYYVKGTDRNHQIREKRGTVFLKR